MTETTQLVKEKLDIVEVIRGYMTLSPAGKNWKGLCPFHKEKSPSFMVSPERQSWHCFGGCNEGGDVISFVMKHENFEFIEALKFLAEKAGVDIQKIGSRDEKQYALLYDIQNEAKAFFRNIFHGADEYAKTAREYLHNRGLKNETIEEFEIGLAPFSSDALTRHLLKTGFRVDDIVRAGFATKTERGTYWDRFRSRIMFPLWNNVGKVVGFTGRILPAADDGKMGKYINSPETPIFQKSKVLFGFHKSKPFIRDSKTAVLVEGQMDFLMTFQDGVKNVIATSGTAITRDHLRALRRVADTLILSFDRDVAGSLAIERTMDLAAMEDFNLKVLGEIADTGGNKDPADMVLAKSGMFAELVASARPAMHYFFDRYLVPNIDSGTLKNNIRSILARVKPMASAIDRSHWIREASRRSGISESALTEELSQMSVPRSPQAIIAEAKASERTPLSRREKVAERLILLGLGENSFLETLRGRADEMPLSCAPLLRAALGDASELSGKQRAEELMLTAQFEGITLATHKDEFVTLLKELKSDSSRTRRDEVTSRIRVLEQQGDEAGLHAALQEFDTISKILQNGK